MVHCISSVLFSFQSWHLDILGIWNSFFAFRVFDWNGNLCVRSPLRHHRIRTEATNNGCDVDSYTQIIHHMVWIDLCLISYSNGKWWTAWWVQKHTARKENTHTPLVPIKFTNPRREHHSELMPKQKSIYLDVEKCVCACVGEDICRENRPDSTSGAHKSKQWNGIEHVEAHIGKGARAPLIGILTTGKYLRVFAPFSILLNRCTYRLCGWRAHKQYFDKSDLWSKSDCFAFGARLGYADREHEMNCK